MAKTLARKEETNFPEFAVHREDISAYFSPPLARSTFHDLVNKGSIIPFKGLRCFYKLNDSLRRLASHNFFFFVSTCIPVQDI